MCSKDPEVSPERGVWLGRSLGRYVLGGGGAEFLGVVIPGVQGGGGRSFTRTPWGRAGSGAGISENPEGSGEPQKLSIILPGMQGAELPSAL